MTGTAPAVAFLGAVTIQVDGRATPVPATMDRAVLVHLLLAEGRALSVDLLIDAVWGQCPPVRARNALQVKISRLRSLLGPHGLGLVHSQGSYRLTIDDDDVDARVFSRLVRDAAVQVATGDLDRARASVEEALRLWRGEPMSELDDHPRLVAARLRLADEWATAQELLAEIALAAGEMLTGPVSSLRKVLDQDPLRPRARLLLMNALERTGRRAEALAVYDAGRRILADETGLAPPTELQDAFHQLLEEERRSARRTTGLEVTRAAPRGAVETARWLASEGDGQAAVSLALRGSWWWWFGGARSAGRDLMEELLDQEASTDLNPRDALRLSAWLAVFQAVEAEAESALQQGERALASALPEGWSRHESLAAVLLSERLFQRGAPARARVLLQAGRDQFVRDRDEWGVALSDVVASKALLLAGDISGAERRTSTLLRTFEELGDPAGQIMALDLAGYCAEIHGDLVASTKIHRRSLDLARRAQAPEWEASQLTRLGSVLSLSGSSEAIGLLEEAVRLSESIQSRTSLALAENGLGLAFALSGDVGQAADAHGRALEWYQVQQSSAGISYSAGRLAHAVAQDDVTRAAALADQATESARRTQDPRAVAHGLEAIACVAPDPVKRARALGAARALRKATASPLPPALNAALLEAERSLHRSLGESLVAELRRGAQDARGRLPARRH